ncbi:hypothetical protein [Oleiagrimonas sp. C23AA]|uniref:hypothetical protein n=1 Tax=Oleiagrimonas sp. C23AA TaxID=2719047 RepID=UPI00141F6F0A|nr:hypothetical protein [Oleiagrimonas sp. C23AA]NII10341.1 hypothetical protein [Oleiagrimonas sp. C23AA]
MAERAARLALDVPQVSALGRFEQLPKWLNLIPTVIHWLALGVRYRSFSLPSALNGAITSGGMVGDGKLEYFAAMGPSARAVTAKYVGIPVRRDTSVQEMLAAMQRQALAFPIIAKPDLGWCGLGVRRVGNAEELAAYLAAFPAGSSLVLQEYIDQPGEAGLFYMREPGQTRGKLTALLLRHVPAVTGDGRSSLGELVARDRRLRRTVNQRHHECRFDPSHVPAQGERVVLSTVASTRVGGRYEDGSELITPVLAEHVDRIARDMCMTDADGFCFGRFDVRFTHMEALRQGQFTIIEVNGTGADVVHAWDPRYSLTEAYRMLFDKQRELFRLADIARQRGRQPMGIFRLGWLYRQQLKLMALYPPSN